MGIRCLIGLTLDGCRFSKGSYTFEFSGKIDGEYKQYDVSTSDCLSFPDTGRIDVRERVSTYLWPLLEQELVDVEENANNFEVIFRFKNGGQFTVWGDDPSIDNLMIVKDASSKNWFPVL